MAMSMAARSDVRQRLGRAGALVGAAILCALSVPASAEVRVVESGPGTLVVEAREATVEQVLETLSESRNFEFHTARPLTRVLSGTYTGTLPRVLARVLDGYDHVVQSTPTGIRLSVVGAAGAPRPVVAGPKGPARPATMPRPVPTSVGQSVSSVSTNVDQDEENAQAAAAPVNAVAPLRPAANPVPTIPAALTGNGRGSTHPRVSTNVDLDEETSR
jgi:hypothetical protein